MIMKKLPLDFSLSKVILDTLFSFPFLSILPDIAIARSGRTIRRISTTKHKKPTEKVCSFFILATFCLSVFVSITSIQAQEIKGFEYYKVITGQNFAEKENSVSPFEVKADESGGQIKVQVNDFGLNRCSEQAAFTWTFDRVLQFFPIGGKFTITGQVGVSGNCTPNSDPFLITSSGGSAAMGLPPSILNTLSQNEQSARGLTLVSNEAGMRIYGKGGSYATRIGAGSDTYSFQGGGVLFLKINFTAGGSGIDQFYDGFAIYFFRPVYADGGRSEGAVSREVQWKECETSEFGKFCGTWNLNPENRTGQASWSNGTTAKLVIKTLTRNEVVITRQDKSGLRATYRGKIQGNSVSGDFSFYWTQKNTKIYKGSWNASW
jgi:hypothetical protein